MYQCSKHLQKGEDTYRAGLILETVDEEHTKLKHSLRKKTVFFDGLIRQDETNIFSEPVSSLTVKNL